MIGTDGERREVVEVMKRGEQSYSRLAPHGRYCKRVSFLLKKYLIEFLRKSLKLGGRKLRCLKPVRLVKTRSSWDSQ